MPEATFSASWVLAFGDESVHPRCVIDRALTEPNFLKALTETIPDMSPEHLLPANLAKWLSKNENRLIKVDESTIYRFSRHGHRWRCVPVKVLAAAE